MSVSTVFYKSPDSSLVDARDATAPESPTSSAATPKRRGRRPSHVEQWTKVTVVLMDRQIVFLDRLVADIRAANGAAISRATLIRAMIDALAESDLDLTASRSQKDLTAVFSARLGRRIDPTA